jgi:hypothetical protein
MALPDAPQPDKPESTAAERPGIRTGGGRPKGSVAKLSKDLAAKLERLDCDPAMALAKLMRWTRPFYPLRCDYPGCHEFSTHGGRRPAKAWCDEHAPADAPQMPVFKNPNEDRQLHKECAGLLMPYIAPRITAVEMDMSSLLGDVTINILPPEPDEKPPDER